jgi:serine/threonine protein kinase
MELETADILAMFPDAQPLSRGGQKAVYTVMHHEYGSCVLKIGKGRSSSALERVRREFEVLRALDTPCFPKAYQLERYPDGRFFILEERLDAVPLSVRICDYTDYRVASRIAADVVSGLRLLWERRVVHRDVKPDNILVSREGFVHIIDLGIARLLDEISVTHDLAPMGPCTPIYAAPEQLANRKREIDYRCDQFSLGIVYAQLLLGGRHPFDPTIAGGGESVLENIFSGRWAKDRLPGDCAKLVILVLQQLLGMEPHQRYRNPEQLEVALRALT